MFAAVVGIGFCRKRVCLLNQSLWFLGKPANANGACVEPASLRAISATYFVRALAKVRNPREVATGKPVWPDMFRYLPHCDDGPERVELKACLHEDANPQWELRLLLAFIVPRRPLRVGKYLGRESAAPLKLLVDLFGSDEVLRSEVRVLKSGDGRKMMSKISGAQGLDD